LGTEVGEDGAEVAIETKSTELGGRVREVVGGKDTQTYLCESHPSNDTLPRTHEDIDGGSEEQVKVVGSKRGLWESVNIE
jgi:hypothetical protein